MPGVFHPSSSDPITFAVPLLSQQLWCIGQDVIRPEGNWLIERGFERLAPTKKNASYPSVYKLAMPGGRYALLRGFGVLFGDPQLGCVFLPRYEFLPCYRRRSTLDRLPWTRDDLPKMHTPSPSQRQACAQLLSGCLDWIADYETQTVEQLGIAYRRATLGEWETDNRELIPAEEMAPAWRRLSAWAASDFNTLFKPQGFGVRVSAFGAKRSSRRPAKPKQHRTALPTLFTYLSRARSITNR